MQFVRTEQLGGQRWLCAVTGRSSDDEGFFDIHRVLSGLDPDVHVSAVAVKEMARQLGWLSPADIEDLVTQAREMGAEIRALQERIEKVETVKALTDELEAVAA